MLPAEPIVRGHGNGRAGGLGGIGYPRRKPIRGGVLPAADPLGGACALGRAGPEIG
jgi:hypothetical protein